jgi:hypothetical protein
VSNVNSLDLYSLLPAIYRIRDADRGYPLRALLGLISRQAGLIKSDIDGLWDDLFIETCADWVIPYIGDLVANNPIYGNIVRSRADVAHTIYYRRRKGTLTMLEQLARDVTGWDAHAVAFFEELGWSQNLNHIRLNDTTNTDPMDPYAIGRVGTVLLRDLDALDRIGSPFDTTVHTVDVRPIRQFDGWYNIQNIGFFLWRLQSFFIQEVVPRRSAAFTDGFHFSPLGNPAQIFVDPRPAPLGDDLVDETQVQSPIRKVAFHFRPGDYYDDPTSLAPSFAIYHGNTANPANLIPMANIVCGDLTNWISPEPGKVAVDVEHGRLAFAPGEVPEDSVTLSYTYGFSAPMGGGPYDRTLGDLVAGDPGPEIPTTVADPALMGILIRVPSPGVTTLTQAIAQWNPTMTPQAVIQIENNLTYDENLTVPFPIVAVPPGQPAPTLVLQAGNLQRPTLIGNITVTGGTGVEELVLSGLLMAGKLHVEGNLGLIEIVHSTLVPGLQLNEEGEHAQPDSASVLVDAPADALQILIDHSISGRLELPGNMIGLVVRDSIIDSPRHEGQADFTPALISGNLSPFPSLSSPTPGVNVTIGDDGPYLATFTVVPTTLAEARDALQLAIQSAHTTLPFRETRVLSTANRLIIVPGGDESIVIEPGDADATAAELRLDSQAARQTSAILSGILSPFPTITAASPQLTVTIGEEAEAVATLASIPSSVAQARDQLQAAIRAAGTTTGFTSAIVVNMDNQLVVISGDGAAPITFSGAAPDSTTLTELTLASRRPAIAADDAGDVPGPPSCLMRTTIFGEVHVRQLPLASEVIFTSVVRCARRQDGCVRFSYLPEGSVTPRRYRCQPDYEIQQESENLERLSGPLTPTDVDAIRDEVRSWLQPSFSDTQYGLPAYGQLFTLCPRQIRTGAEDGSEMGAFCSLKQPQRATSLRVRLQEYLPFGLEPGLIYVT